MILQNCIFPYQNEYAGLYYRVSGGVCQEKEYVSIPSGQILSTDTYMNALDIDIWKKYTEVSDIYFKIHYEGKGKVYLVCEQKQGIRQQLEYVEDYFHKGMLFPKEFQTGIVYFILRAEDNVKLYGASFETNMVEKRVCKLALIICTYKRKQYLENILQSLSDGMEIEDTGCWMDVKVIDNASELEDNYGEHIRIFHNQNSGGSGGFSRGMDEVIKNLRNFQATHVVLMDDDVIVNFESFIRLKALLSYEREDYLLESVAGRMFCLDRPNTQYTAAEIWNDGYLKHIGWNIDMTEKRSIWEMNDNSGAEYSGWWFACYPIDYVKHNRPFPFFIHCDDVEYGLRHGGTPLVLNGIQVWHEIAENRQTPVISYYDIRNSLILNEIRNGFRDFDAAYKLWKQRIGEAHRCCQWTKEYLIIIGFSDYLKGLKKILSHNPEKLHDRLMQLKGNRYKNAFVWRLVALRFYIRKFVALYKRHR